MNKRRIKHILGTIIFLLIMAAPYIVGFIMYKNITLNTSKQISSLQETLKQQNQMFNLKIQNIITEKDKDKKDVDAKLKATDMIIQRLDRAIKDPPIPRRFNETSRGGNYFRMRATAYDLSVESCGKSKSSPSYGITATGTYATFGRTVAVDPKIIPLGSILYVVFPDEYKNLNGYYKAEDTGSGINGSKIDIFLGEEAYKESIQFGIRQVKVYVVRRG